MPVVRVYLPVGRADLAELASSGTLSAGRGAPREAYLVTPGLEAAGGSHDSEDLEYTAFGDAVEAAGRRRDAPGDRRVVAAADADPEWVVPREGTPVTRVALTTGLARSRIAAFHIDEKPGAHDGTDDLLWYDVTEFDEVRALLG